MRKILFCCALLACVLVSRVQAEKPNVLFISIDDLNDWVSCMGGHPQAKTPNLDRLAASGVLFRNAHCPAPACNPSRGAILSGVSPHVSGLYDNRQKMRERMPDTKLLPKYFSQNGYWSAGSGKILHYFIDAQSWDEYFPPKETEDPFPRTFYPPSRPVSLPRGGPWQYIETDWAALDISDEEFGGDWLVSKWVGEQLAKQHEQPFFLACGIYRPHEPWFVPKKYFEQFPLDEIQLPPGYLENDINDLPEAGKQRGPNKYFAHIQGQGQWKQGIQGYLASIAFADAMLGRVLDALDRGPNRDNTIVVLWSDHGWHLGEKQHWQKFTAWRVCTRVPLIARVPAGTTGLTSGTAAGSVCDQPVNLLSLFPTLTELAGLPAQASCDAPSLVPLLKDPQAEWSQVSITWLGKPGNYAVSGKRWRLIQYDNGERELYDIDADPFEWSNLANDPSHADVISRLSKHVPAKLAKYVSADVDALPKLEWHPAVPGAKPPASKPDGNKFDVVFTNRLGAPAKVYWVDRKGMLKSYGTLEAGWRKPIRSRPGAVWMIADKNDRPLGRFVVGDQPAHCVIPPQVADAK